MHDLLTIDDVLDSPLPPGVQRHEVTSAMVVVEYIDAQGRTQVGWACSENVGLHRHIGALMLTLDDLRSALLRMATDG